MTAPFTDSYDAIYSFNYQPKWKEKLPFYDKTPLMFPLKFYRRKTLGINLHWLKSGHRVRFVDYLRTVSLKIKDKNKLARIVYNTIKSTPALQYLLQGIRLYFNNRVSKLQVIGRQDMLRLLSRKLSRNRPNKVWKNRNLYNGDGTRVKSINTKKRP